MSARECNNIIEYFSWTFQFKEGLSLNSFTLIWTFKQRIFNGRSFKVLINYNFKHLKLNGSGRVKNKNTGKLRNCKYYCSIMPSKIGTSAKYEWDEEKKWNPHHLQLFIYKLNCSKYFYQLGTVSQCISPLYWKCRAMHRDSKSVRKPKLHFL